MQIKKSEIQSAIATTIISIIILLILFLFGMTANRNEVDEGVMVSFGYDEDGFGSSTDDIASQPETAAPLVTQPSVAPSEEDLMTQVDPSVALEAEKRKRNEEQQRINEERLRQEKLEKQRQAEREAREAAIKAEREAKSNKAGSMIGGAFTNKGSGSGNGSGSGVKGNPAGRGSQGGNSWELGGRDIIGRLSQPSYKSNEEGTIVVQIRVDANGKVTSATIAKGTTITNEKLRQESIAAAKRNKFSISTGVAIGKITYKFVLN